MNKRIDFSFLGGFPLEQDTLDFMQQNYNEIFGGLAALCGNKVIITGVEVAGGNVSAGWIVYNGEFIRFIGGAAAANVTITETPTAVPFEDGNNNNVYYTKTATCGVLGDFPFSDLVPLLSLQNTWKKDDVRMSYKDNVYIAANFQPDGTGINAEKGWRILAKALTDTAGKVFVNWDGSVTDYNAVGKIGGAITRSITLVANNIPAAMTWRVPLVQHTASGGSFGVTDGPPGGSGFTDVPHTNLGGGQPFSFDNRQPYFVMLHLIKL